MKTPSLGFVIVVGTLAIVLIVIYVNISDYIYDHKNCERRYPPVNTTSELYEECMTLNGYPPLFEQPPTKFPT